MDFEGEFVAYMKNLAACRLQPQEWFVWWRENGEKIEAFAGRIAYLHLKPRAYESPWISILSSQEGAIGYLEKKGISFEQSDDYQKRYEKELDDFCKEQRRREKEALRVLQESHPLLFERYPKFAASLRFIFSEGDEIAPGATDEAIREIGGRLGYPLPEDVAFFFRTTSRISLEGIRLDLEEIHPTKLWGSDWYVLGEFWKDGDGDSLLIKLGEAGDETEIYYYAHEARGKDQIRRLRKSMRDLIEKEFAAYNRN